LAIPKGGSNLGGENIWFNGVWRVVLNPGELFTWGLFCAKFGAGIYGREEGRNFGPAGGAKKGPVWGETK